ncbi:hypothetical protein NKH09_10535 [Mesorhizobium sp. M1339]|uniref:hypothetical protein n=1 Tax=Mesorhizobium sp. M1339 TaxID=2957086 RepID=UPI00333BD48B
MATDSRAYSGGGSPIGFKKKLHVLPNGALVASSGHGGQTDAFAKWCSQVVNEGHPLPARTHDSKIGVKALPGVDRRHRPLLEPLVPALPGRSRRHSSRSAPARSLHWARCTRAERPRKRSGSPASTIP